VHLLCADAAVVRGQVADHGVPRPAASVAGGAER
jgi:hypothetical protein